MKNRLKITRNVVIFCALLGGSPVSHANTQEAELKAAFLVNFAKFVEWLDNVNKPPEAVEFCLFGVERYRHVFSSTIESKAIKGLAPVTHVKTFDEDISNCDVAYIGGLQTPQRRYLQAQLKDKPILTVGEDTDFIRDGGIIRLYAEQGKLRFEINPDAATANRLKVSSRLLRLAKITKTSEPSGAEK